MTTDRYPNLFLAGAPKCGTTSLAHYLGQHPEVFSPAVKEPVFFGSDLTAKSRMTTDAYLQLYQGWGKETFAMDASTHYLYAERAANEIHDASPSAQIIIMVRNPVEAAHSMYHQLRFNGAETLDTFEASLDAEAGRATSLEPIRKGFPENFLYRNIYAFSRNIPRFEAVFGTERVHVVFLEDLKADPSKEVIRLCQTLALDPAPVSGFDFGTQNTAKRPRAGWVNTLANYPPEWLRWFTAPFPKPLRIGLRKALARANTVPASNPPLSDESRAFLAREFAGEVDWLSERFDRDLSHWRA